MHTKELEDLKLLHYNPFDKNGKVLCPPFHAIHNHLLCLDHVEGEVVILAPYSQVSDLLPIDWLIVVVSNFNDCFGVVLDHAITGEQAVQEGTQHAPLKGPCVGDQCDRCVVTYPYHLPIRKSRIQEVPGSLA